MNQAEDVEIVLGHKRYYKFHSGVLARNCALFADMLTEPNAVKLSSRARNAGIKTRWMIELKCLPCEKYPAGHFELVKLTRNGGRADNRSGLIVNENGRIPEAEKCFSFYESIFYALYNKELRIPDSDMIAALEACYELLEKSDYLGCTSVISKPIEVALLKHGQDVFRAIANMPQAWIDMAFRIRSEFLFRECVIHLTGNWRNVQSQSGLRERLARIPGLTALIERLHTQLLARCEKLEVALVTWYPSAMLRPSAAAGDAANNDDNLPVRREAYAKDILAWLALTFFRHWVAHRLAMDKGRHAADCGFALYKQLGDGGDAYLDRGAVSQFHDKFPMTSKALRVVEHHLVDIKSRVSDLVRKNGILESKCQLDVHRFPVQYLTCVGLGKGEFPWGSWEVEEHAAARGKKRFRLGGNEIALANLDSAKKNKEMSVVSVEGGEEENDELESEEDAEAETDRKHVRT